MRIALLVCGFLLAAAFPTLAQERGVADWAPRWKIGDTWVVKAYQKDRSRERTSPQPAEGAMPRLPIDETAQIPEFPPLRNGIPVGYKIGNTFEFEVLRLDKVKHEDDGPGVAPEQFWVISVKSVYGEPIRRAELWYAARDMVLSKVVLDPGTKGEKVTWTSGTAQFNIGPSHALGLPLDWPDLKAAKSTRKELKFGKRRIEQQVRTMGKDEKAEVQVRLRLVKAKRDAPRPEVKFAWKKGSPFWTRILARDYLCVLDAK